MFDSDVTRRQFTGRLARLAPMCLALCGCDATPLTARRARVTARHHAPDAALWKDSAAAAADLGPDVAVSLPSGVAHRPAPLIVLLHGAGGRGYRILDLMLTAIGHLPAVVIAPNSIGPTWDVLVREATSLFDVLEGSPEAPAFGPDVVALDRALDRVFQHVQIDPARMAIAGFSDGATYALALGLANGDLFSRVVALTPGFIPRVEAAGTAGVFVAHGRGDRVFPIDRCGRRIATTMRSRGHDVTFREFDGGHEINDVVVREALAWATADRATWPPRQSGA